jgi:hypothetical protein
LSLSFSFGAPLKPGKRDLPGSRSYNAADHRAARVRILPLKRLGFCLNFHGRGQLFGVETNITAPQPKASGATDNAKRAPKQTIVRRFITRVLAI